MNKICTSLEQSQKLIELGVDVNTADVCWSIDIPDLPTLLAYPITDCDNWENKIPAWSLSALLDLLPKGEDTVIDLCFGGYKGEEYIDEWFCSFEDNKEPFEFHSYSNKDKLDVTFEMVVWLKENNKL